MVNRKVLLKIDQLICIHFHSYTLQNIFCLSTTYFQLQHIVQFLQVTQLEDDTLKKIVITRNPLPLNAIFIFSRSFSYIFFHNIRTV